MSDLAQRLAGLSPAQRKLLEQRLAKRQPAAAAAEPIAIIGMACRFPGAPNLDAFWRLIREGRSAAGEVPADRWNADEFYDPTGETPGKMSVRWAALDRRARPVRSAVLRHHAARSGADGPAAAAAAGSRLGGDGERRPAGRPAGRHADRRVRRHRRHRLLEDLPCRTTTITSRSTPTWARATRCRSRPIGCRTFSISTARARRSTRPAAARRWRFTLRSRACGAANRTRPWPAA